MDFSSIFSRKDKKNTVPVSEPALVKPKGRELAIAQINERPLTEQHFDTGLMQSRIEVTEVSSHFPPGMEDAAMLYANGRVADAISLLQMFLLQTPNESGLWLMLFDLYNITGQQEEFEKLALDYTIRREQSPPAWKDRLVNGNDMPGLTLLQPGATGNGQLFSLKGRLDITLAERIQLLREAAAVGAIQIDLSGISAVTPEGCELLQHALADLQKQGVRLQIASGALIGLLQHYVARPEEAAAPQYWLLLLQLYQMQGKLAEFEDLAVSYAVQFEVSPPSWEAPRQPVRIVAGAEPHHDADVPQPGNVFSLRGVLGARSTAVLAELRNFAAGQADVVLDMASVDRIEFSSVSMLMETLISLSALGKKISIAHCNMLVYVLLVVMGIDQIAQVVAPVYK